MAGVEGEAVEDAGIVPVLAGVAAGLGTDGLDWRMGAGCLGCCGVDEDLASDLGWVGGLLDGFEGVTRGFEGGVGNVEATT